MWTGCWSSWHKRKFIQIYPVGTLDTCSFRAGRFCISPVKVENKWFLENIRGHLFLWNSYHHGSVTEIEKTLVIIYHEIEDVLDKEIVMVQGRKNFADSIKSKATKTLLKEKLYGKIKGFYAQLLNDLYTNIQIFK